MEFTLNLELDDAKSMCVTVVLFHPPRPVATGGSLSEIDSSPTTIFSKQYSRSCPEVLVQLVDGVCVYRHITSNESARSSMFLEEMTHFLPVIVVSLVNLSN